MAYTAWSVVFGEQPTAAKWNQLGQNDAGFKDGTNIDNLAILTRHIAALNITKPKLEAAVTDMLDFSTTEKATGFTWTDGKVIYKQTFTITTIGSSSEQITNIALSTSTTRILKVEGGIWFAGTNPEFYPIEYINPAATTLQNMQTKLSYLSGTGWQVRFNTGAAGSLSLTVYFVK